MTNENDTQLSLKLSVFRTILSSDGRSEDITEILISNPPAAALESGDPHSWLFEIGVFVRNGDFGYCLSASRVEQVFREFGCKIEVLSE